MKTMTARELKNHSGEIIRTVSKGEEIIVTYRGKPAAVIIPFEEAQKRGMTDIRPFEKAWKDIEESIEASKPAFKTWKEATRWIRKRVLQ